MKKDERKLLKEPRAVKMPLSPPEGTCLGRADEHHFRSDGSVNTHIHTHLVQRVCNGARWQTWLKQCVQFLGG